MTAVVRGTLSHTTVTRHRARVRRSVINQVIWIGPTVLVIALVIVYPMIEMVRTSFTEVSASGVIKEFNGVQNYVGLFSRAEFVPILGQTGLWLGSVVIGTIIVAWPLAMLLNAKFPGRRWVRYAVIVPWAAALPMSTLIFKWMFNFNFGAVNKILLDLGIVDAPVDWLGSTNMAWATLIALGIFVSVPYNTYILLAGLQSVPEEVYEASKLDGAGPIRTWWEITLPMLRTSTFLAIILNIIGVFNSFALIWVLTGGGPGRTTQTTFTYMYELAFGARAMGQSAALSVINMLLLAVIVVIYLRLNRRALKEF